MANVGIAMGAAGSDIALETADIALMTDQLERIPEALRISRATLRVIRQNLAIALITVGALLTEVMLREVNMAGGMLIHEVWVLIVILNGMRLMRSADDADDGTHRSTSGDHSCARWLPDEQPHGGSLRRGLFV